MSDSELIRSYPHPVLRPDSDDFIDKDYIKNLISIKIFSKNCVTILF